MNFVSFVVKKNQWGFVTKAALIVCLTVVAVGVGLSAQAPRPTFEVVSIKPDQNPAAPFGIRPVFGNRFSAVITVNVLIAEAYGERSALPLRPGDGDRAHTGGHGAGLCL